MLYHKADGPLTHYIVSALSTSTTVKHDKDIYAQVAFIICCTAKVNKDKGKGFLALTFNLHQHRGFKYQDNGYFLPISMDLIVATS